MKLNGIESPRVAVQALNPHAEFGNEEKDEIIPAIEEAKKIGINADGPLPCDTSFITAYKNKNKGGLLPSFAHGMTLELGVKGAIQDVVTEHFNSNMSSQDAVKKLSAAVKAAS